MAWSHQLANLDLLWLSVRLLSDSQACGEALVVPEHTVLEKQGVSSDGGEAVWRPRAQAPGFLSLGFMGQEDPQAPMSAAP